MTFSITYCLEKIRIKEYSECEIDSALNATCIHNLFFKKVKVKVKTKAKAKVKVKVKVKTEKLSI